MRFALLLLGFVALVLTGDRILFVAGRALLDRSEYRLNRIFSERVEADIAIFGNSRALHGLYAPDLSRALGRNVQNLAVNAMSSPMVEVLLSTLEEQGRLPRGVIVEVSNCDDVNPGVALALAPWRDRWPAVDAVLRTELPTESIYHDVILLSRLNGEQQRRSLAYLGRTDQTYIAPAARRLDPSFSRRPPKPFRLRCTDDGRAAYRRTVALLSKRHVDAVFFLGPMADPRVASTEKTERYLKDIRAVVEPTYRVFDLRRVLTDPRLFSDPVHLNAKGAAALFEHMQGEGILSKLGVR